MSAMNGGDGTNSYSKNSKHQRKAAKDVQGEIHEEINKNLDVKALLSVSNIIRIVDLGCSTGPNTFKAMQSVLEAIKLKHASQCPNSESPEFQVFFSDQASNDFNTLFAALPSDRQYFAAGVPGSFHGRLFPESSLHLVYSCFALHWLSKTPEQVLDKNSLAWNKGKVYYVNAPKEVHNAYISQFKIDIDNFLNARAKEIVGGGMMVIIMPGLPHDVDSQFCTSTTSLLFDNFASIFMEMAKEGLIDEALVDSFNMPIYGATPEEMHDLVEINGFFSTQKIEFVNTVISDTSERNVIKQVRAGLEGTLSKHFGSEATDEMFERLDHKFKESDELMTSFSKKPNGQLFIFLKRK